RRIAPDERMLRDPDELVDAARGADGRVVADLDVTGQSRRVGEDDAATDPAIVADVRVRHEEIPVADPRHAASADGAAADRHVLADLVPGADLERRRLALVLEILRRATEAGERRDHVVRAERDLPVENDVRLETGPIADRRLGADDAERAD